jgi:signal transduction histidine kinase
MKRFAVSSDPSARELGSELLAETGRIEAYLASDGADLGRLFEALNRKHDANLQSLHDALSRRGSEGARRLNALEQSVKRQIGVLAETARAREQRAIWLLFGLSLGTLLVSIAVALYARRNLKPLAVVTERAKSVARGDLTPRSVVASNDEIGELAQTFENMVAAIARANEQLLASERLATIGKMAAHVTHEVRNPLSSIALNLELLEDDLRGNAEASGLLRAIRAEVDRLTALSEQYLSVARQQPLMLEEEDVGQVVGEAVEFSKGDLARHGVELAFHTDPDLPPARLDESQLKQAVFNLIRNAREAMPSGGRVELVVCRADGGGIDVIVDDEGSGIDDEARARLFEPFFTTKKHGTGLGLAITRQIVEAHGGAIACEARPRSGTRMRIHLPELDTSDAPVSARRAATAGP